MRRLSYYFREGFRIFSRSGITGMLSIFAFAILAFTGHAIWVSNSTLESAHHQVLSMFDLEVYLVSSETGKADSLAALFSEREAVISTQVISKENAAEIFSGEYGEELFSLLEENPLPASIIITYSPGSVDREFLALEALEIATLEDVDEVIYEGELLERIEIVAGKTKQILTISAVGILLIALILTMQAVRVAAKSVKAWVRAVILVGGSGAQLKVPFMISASFSGLIGSIVGTLIAQVLLSWSENLYGLIPAFNWEISIIVVLLNILIGSIVALIAAPRGLEHTPVV